MTVTKKRLLYPTKDFQSIEAGYDVNEGIPLRWLESLVQDALRRIKLGATSEEDKTRVEREANSAKVLGTNYLKIVYDDELTPMENLTDKIEEQERILAKVKDVLNSREISKEQLDNLRRTLGINLNPEGTPAAPAAPFVPTETLNPDVFSEESRKAIYMTYFRESGWNATDHRYELWVDAKNRNLNLSEIERWLEIPAGSLEQAARDRGKLV